MSYAAYASMEDYARLFPTGPVATEETLSTASRHVDALTFNRIPAAGGLAALSEFQRTLVTETTCRQAAFETENAETIGSALTDYSVNGVRMRFGAGWNVFSTEGVVMRREVYALLAQTGLCCRVVG